MLNKKSGVHAIAKQVPDFREIEISSCEGNEEAQMAVENFNYTIAGFVAKYAAALNGVDTIIFTGGIGENKGNIRKAVCDKLAFMGVNIDLKITLNLCFLMFHKYIIANSRKIHKVKVYFKM